MAVVRRVAIALEIDQPYPQHQEIFAGVQRYAREHTNWHCLIDEHPAHAPQRRGPDYGTYDGVIARATPTMQRRLNRNATPYVNVLFQTARDGVPGVYPDASKLGQAAADHLLERGFRSFCYMGEINLHRHTAEVAKAFKAHAEEAGASCELLRLPNPSFLDTAGYLELERLINRWVDRLSPPVALFAEEAPVGRMVIQRCQQSGWDVPRDIAILSQHNLKSVVDVTPQISSIEIDNELAGYEAARLLDKMMAGKAAPANPVLIPPKRVVGRESTDYAAVEDPLVAQALRYIAGQLDQPMRVDQIAYELAVSPRTLQLRFDQALGHGVSQEIRRLRLAKAKRLLTEPGHTIGEIGELTGFGRPQLFSAVFRRELGMTPGEYRRQASGE